MTNAAYRNEEATDLIHCFAGGVLSLYDCSCFTSFCKVFVAGFNITWPIRFLEVYVGSPSPINRGKFEIDEDGQMIAGQ